MRANERLVTGRSHHPSHSLRQRRWLALWHGRRHYDNLRTEIGYACLFGYGFEVGDRVVIEPNGDRPLELRGERAFASFGKIIFFAHMSPSVRFHG